MELRSCRPAMGCDHSCLLSPNTGQSSQSPLPRSDPTPRAPCLQDPTLCCPAHLSLMAEAVFSSSFGVQPNSSAHIGMAQETERRTTVSLGSKHCFSSRAHMQLRRAAWAQQIALDALVPQQSLYGGIWHRSCTFLTSNSMGTHSSVPKCFPESRSQL